jgi:hypothetical protein
LISQAELIDMRLSAQSTMPDVCNIQKQTYGSDGAGGAPLTWTDDTVNCPCRLTPYVLRSEEQVGGERQQELRMWMVALPVGTTVDGSYRIKISALNNTVLATPRFFRIEVVEDGSFAVQLQLKCTEIPETV